MFPKAFVKMSFSLPNVLARQVTCSEFFKSDRPHSLYHFFLCPRSTFKGVQSPTNNACRLLNAGRDRDVDEAKLPCLLLAVLLVFIVAVHTNV